MELNDMRKIATLYPKDRVVDGETVLALLSRLEQAERVCVKLRNRFDAMRRQRDGYRNQLRRTEQQIQRVRKLHTMRFYDKWGRDSLEPVGHGGWCSECGRFEGDSCATIRALDGESRCLADQGLGDNLARTTKNGDAP